MSPEADKVTCWHYYYEKDFDGTITKHPFAMPFSADMVLTFIEAQADHSSTMIFVKLDEAVLFDERHQIELIQAGLRESFGL